MRATSESVLLTIVVTAAVIVVALLGYAVMGEVLRPLHHVWAAVGR